MRMVAVALAMVVLACLMFAALSHQTITLLREERDRHDRVLESVLARVKAPEPVPVAVRTMPLKAAGSNYSREQRIEAAREL